MHRTLHGHDKVLVVDSPSGHTAPTKFWIREFLCSLMRRIKTFTAQAGRSPVRTSHHDHNHFCSLCYSLPGNEEMGGLLNIPDSGGPQRPIHCTGLGRLDAQYCFAFPRKDGSRRGEKERKCSVRLRYRHEPASNFASTLDQTTDIFKIPSVDVDTEPTITTNVKDADTTRTRDSMT